MIVRSGATRLRWLIAAGGLTMGMVAGPVVAPRSAAAAQPGPDFEELARTRASEVRPPVSVLLPVPEAGGETVAPAPAPGGDLAHPPASPRARIRSLARGGRARLSRLFDGGVAPAPGELAGRVLGLGVLPLGIHVPFEKVFGNPGEVRMHPLKAALARFTVRPVASVAPPHAPVLRLDYALASNPPGVRWIFDEVRRVGPGQYVGWTYLALPGGRSVRLMPFVLVA